MSKRPALTPIPIWGICTGCVCLFLTACGTLTKVQIDHTEAQAMHYARNRNLSAEVESLARPLVEKGETPGIVVGVLLPDGSSSMYGYGVTDRQSGRKPDGDTLFAIGSLSKGFLGAITALLVQDGTLSWSDTLETLLPPDTPLSADAKKITLIQLATHTSGLPNQPKNFQIFRYFVEYLFTGKSFYRHLNEAYVLKSLSDFKAPRHAQVLYSSLGYAMLGYAIEKRTGLSLDALLEQKLTQPLGLRNTGYEPRSLPGYSTRAYGYAGDHPFFIRRGRPVPDWEFTEFMKGAGGVYSTANDLLTFAAAHLQDPKTALGRGLSDTLQVRVPRPEESPAVAWFVDDIEGQRITYQVGVVAGYTSYLGLDVERRIAVVVLENSFNRTNKVGHKLLMRLGRALPKAAEIK